MRVPVVDRWVLDLCGRKLVHPSDFETDASGGVKLTRERFPKILTAWEQLWVDHSCRRLVDDHVRAFITALGADEMTGDA